MITDEDEKLIKLARGARLRSYVVTGAPAGAAVRDVDGRTYAGATVENASAALSLSALRAAVAAAVSSGARAFEAAVVVGEVAADDLAVLREFGEGVPVLVADAGGAVTERLST